MSVCPKGHTSASSDYCDECGAPIDAATTPAAHAPTGSQACPDCAMPRESGARFCEVCQYDFQEGVGGTSNSRVARSDSMALRGLADLGASPSLTSTPSIAPHPVDLSLVMPTPIVAQSFFAPMLARIHADPALAPDDEARSAYPTEGIADRIFHLDLDENMVGRESASKNTHPEIPLRDPGASRRHLKIAKLNGVFHALELGSANGTLLDGIPLEPGVPAPLHDGSVLRLGIWTTIRIEPR